jgi:hypothetical protein
LFYHNYIYILLYYYIFISFYIIICPYFIRLNVGKAVESKLQHLVKWCTMSVFLHRSTDCLVHMPSVGLDLSGFAPGEPWNHPWSIWEPSSLCFRPFGIFKFTSNYKDPKWSQCRNLIVSTDQIQDARVKGLAGQGWFPLRLHGIWKPGASTWLETRWELRGRWPCLPLTSPYQ